MTAIIVVILLTFGVCIGFVVGVLVSTVIDERKASENKLRKQDLIAKLERNKTEYIEDNLVNENVSHSEFDAVRRTKEHTIDLIQKVL